MKINLLKKYNNKKLTKNMLLFQNTQRGKIPSSAQKEKTVRPRKIMTGMVIKQFIGDFL